MLQQRVQDSQMPDALSDCLRDLLLLHCHLQRQKHTLALLQIDASPPWQDAPMKEGQGDIGRQVDMVLDHAWLLLCKHPGLVLNSDARIVSLEEAGYLPASCHRV